MKLFTIGLLTVAILIASCATNHAASSKWLSAAEMQSQLESIAKDYAKEHKIDFDFNSAHFAVYAVTFHASSPATLNPQPLCKGVPVFGTIYFDHGLGKNSLMMMIDNDGKVIDAQIVKPEVDK